VDGRPAQHLFDLADGYVKTLREGGGTFALMKVRLGADVRVAELGKPRVDLEQTIRASASDGRDMVWDWGPDGRLLYQSDGRGSVSVVAHALGDRPERVGTGPQNDYLPRSMGDAVLFHRIDRTESRARCQFLRAAADEEPTVVLTTDAYGGSSDNMCAPIRCSHTTPPKCLLEELAEPDSLFRILDVDSGELGPVLFRRKRTGNLFWGLSPDGTKVAWPQEMADDPRVVVADVATQEVTSTRTPRGFVPHDLSFAADGASFLASGSFPPERTNYVVELTPSGALREIVRASTMPHNPVASPDGRSVAFTIDRTERNVWILSR